MAHTHQSKTVKSEKQSAMAREAPTMAKPKNQITRVAPPSVPQQGNSKDREAMISMAAYYRAERRGFNGGDPLADWLEAEAEVDALLH